MVDSQAKEARVQDLRMRFAEEILLGQNADEEVEDDLQLLQKCWCLNVNSENIIIFNYPWQSIHPIQSKAIHL